MPELSHDTADDGFHEIQLNGKQLVFVFIMATLVSVAIFLCGVLVGRGARAARGEDQIEATRQTPVTAPAPVADAGPPSAEPPPAAAETPDELSYHKRLQAAGSPSEELKPPAAAPATPAAAPATPAAAPATRTAAPATRTPAPATPTAAPATPAAAPATRTAAPATRAATPPPPAATAPAPVVSEPAPAVPADVPTAGRPGAYVIQVQALRDRDVASSLVKRLTGKGYPAFLVSPAPGSTPSFFRVQVGRYADRREAENVKTRLMKEEQFKPWITQ